MLLFTIFIIVVTQKLVLQQSKKRHSKVYGNPIAPSFYSILLGLKYIIFALKVTNSDINISIIFSVIISIFIFDLSAYLLVTIWPDFYLKFFWNSTEENRKICNIFYLVNSYFFIKISCNHSIIKSWTSCAKYKIIYEYRLILQSPYLWTISIFMTYDENGNLPLGHTLYTKLHAFQHSS